MIEYGTEKRRWSQKQSIRKKKKRSLVIKRSTRNKNIYFPCDASVKINRNLRKRGKTLNIHSE